MLGVNPASDPFFNGGAMPPFDGTIADLVRFQAEADTGRVALSDQNLTLTYGELDQLANGVARALHDAGVVPGDVVGILFEDALRSVVAMLGTWKAGAAYLPLDVALPEQRLTYMKRQARIAAIITDSSSRGLWASDNELTPVVDFESATPTSDGGRVSVGCSSDLAYVMFTSGSTGAPKGVEVPHEAIRRLVVDDQLALSPEDVLLQLATQSFDSSVFEIWGILCAGGRLEFPGPAPTFGEISRAVAELGINKLFLTTGLFHQLAQFETQAFRHLDTLFVGGDVLSPRHASEILISHPGLRLVNLYGPTETAVAVTRLVMSSPEDVDPCSVPLGEPIVGTRLLVLDESGGPCPTGVPGELCVAGKAVARGYRHQKELTDERFVRFSWGASARTRIYRTGDLCVLTSERHLRFLGRLDDQLKIRGYRVEPGEVEAVLHDHPDVRTAVVIALPDGSGARSLVAVVQHGRRYAGPSAMELRSWCRGRLPGYMCPTRWIPITDIPLNPNGKVDRGAILSFAEQELEREDWK